LNGLTAFVMLGRGACTRHDPGDEATSEGEEAQAPGVYRAAVLEAEDLEGRARVLIALPPELAGRTVWAEVATAFLPQPGDEVVVAFEAADPRRPYVVGMVWHGSDPLRRRAILRVRIAVPGS
jgi:hypothetical protein